MNDKKDVDDCFWRVLHPVYNNWIAHGCKSASEKELLIKLAELK